MASRPVSRDDFEIVIITALPVEYNAIWNILDNVWDEHSDTYGRARGDPNYYTTGRIGKCNVVLVQLPYMGKSGAASTASSMRSSYCNLRLAVLAGVCGGIPFTKDGEEILLGDVIISKAIKAINQYYLGHQDPNAFACQESILDNLGRPNKDIRNLVNWFETDPGIDWMEERIAYLPEAITE